MRFTKRNLKNIQHLFEEKTGVILYPNHSFSFRKAALLAVTAACCLLLAAFTYPLFTPLEGDALSLSGTYEGNGIVSVHVENRSEKPLRFQKQLKLINWFTEEEAPKLEGEVLFSNVDFPAGTSGTMIIDLSQTYDIAYLEQDVTNPWYYLLLTNQDFLFGHDWMCSVFFRQDDTETAESSLLPEEVPAAQLEQIEESLRFYFEASYEGCPIALNDANFPYLQKVEEFLMRSDGTVVPSLSPSILVSSPSVFLDPEPMLKKLPEGIIWDPSVPEESQYLLGLDYWTHSDAYGRLIATRDEQAWAIHAMLPQQQGEIDGGIALPLVFLMVYDTQSAVQEGSCAYLYGQLLSFGELESRKVYADEHYVIYDATDLIYTDVDAYLDYFLSCQSQVYCDDQIRQRVHNIYTYYRDPQNLQQLIAYREIP